MAPDDKPGPGAASSEPLDVPGGRRVRGPKRWILASLVSLVSTAALFAPLKQGIPRATDLPDHLGTVAQVLREIHRGDLYPRWMANFHDGWGEPTLVYYPPGIYLSSSLMALAFRSDVLAGFVAALALFAFLGSLGVFYLVARRFGDLAATVASLLFAALPFRVFELYASGLYSAFAAGCLLPWVFLSLCRAADEDEGIPEVNRWRLGWPLLCAAVVLTNLPTAVLLCYLIAVWILFQRGWARRRYLAGQVLPGLAVGLLVAAVYLLPAVLELSEIQIPSGPRAIYTSNFLFQGQQSWMTPGLRSMFDRMALFPAAALVLAFGVLAAAARRRLLASGASVPVRLLSTVSLTAFFLMTPISLPLWKILPFLRYVNLPWRLLEPFGTAVVALCAAALALLLQVQVFPLPSRAFAVIGFLALFSLWGVFAASISAVNGKFPAAACKASIPRYERKQGYFLARGARSAAQLAAVPTVQCDRPCQVKILEWSPARRRFFVLAPLGTRLGVRTYFFPGWKAARAGGQRGSLPLQAEPGTGRILIDIPPGSGEVVLRFGTTPIRVIGWITSLLSLGVALLLRFKPVRGEDPA